MAFPISPVDGQVYNQYIYSSTKVAWERNNSSFHYVYGGTGTWTVQSVNLSDTSWYTLDFSSVVPANSNLMLVHFHVGTLGGTEAGLLLAKRPSDTKSIAEIKTDHPKYEITRVTHSGWSDTIWLPCDGGIVQLAQYSTSYALNACFFELKGYYI